MQSGKGKAGKWVLSYEPETAKTIDPLMGYTSSGDMSQQIKITFSCKEEAVAYAERENIAYKLIEPRKKKTQIASYSENFRHDRIAPWTH